MLPLLAAAAPAVIAGAASLFGQQSANQTNVQMQREANATNIAEAEKNRDFQAQMSNTAHQRQVADLKAAGLNPLLSANQSGASSPSGATAQADSARVENEISGALTSAVEMKNLQLGMAKNAAELDSMEAQRRLTDQQTKESRVRTRVHEKEIPKSDIINRGYKLVEPVIGKVEEALRSSSRAASRKTTKTQRSLLSPEHMYDQMGNKEMSFTFGKP